MTKEDVAQRGYEGKFRKQKKLKEKKRMTK